MDILLVGMDSRADAHGNPLSPEELASLPAWHSSPSKGSIQVSVRGVRINPGAMPFTRMPSGPSSSAAVSAKKQIPALETP